MTTSDQPGNQPLTRKQLREIRLTGTTPVISEEESAAAKAATAVPSPKPAPAVDAAPAPEPAADVESNDAPLTRRRVRQQERIRTESVPVVVPEEPTAEESAPEGSAPEESAPEELVVEELVVDDADSDANDDDDEIVDVVPVSAAAAADSDADAPTEQEEASDTDERPVVSPAFGKELLTEQPDVPAFTPSFDELITSDSGGSNNLAPNTLIFTPSAGERSLSGPVASTGEILVTGSYELPRGIGSQGHAHGTADGREVDAVLIDGELPAQSSPTPVAASSAVSTIKPAGEVIRPPAPEKGNKLMLTLAITAGGLALVLAAALVIAFNMNVF